MSLTPELQANLAKIAQAAVLSEKESGCPAELSAAQCILESGWLRVCPGNNCFGIKDTDRFPGRHYTLTKEFISGTWKTCSLAFEVYPTLADCFRDHGELLKRGKPYAEAWERYKRAGELRLEQLALEIAPIYGSDPGYGRKVLSLMRQPEVVVALKEARGANSA